MRILARLIFLVALTCLLSGAGWLPLVQQSTGGGPITFDAFFQNNSGSTASLLIPSTSTLSTAGPNERLVLVAEANGSTLTVSGCGLTWTKRTSLSSGGSFYEEWTAYASAQLTNCQVTAAQSPANFINSVIMAFKNTDSTAGAGTPPFDANGSLPNQPVGASAMTISTTTSSDVAFAFTGNTSQNCNSVGTGGIWIQVYNANFLQVCYLISTSTLSGAQPFGIANVTGSGDAIVP